MKLIISFIFFICYFKVSSQIDASRQSDSLYKALKVKLRITKAESKYIGALDKAETFDANGRVIDEFWFDRYPTVLKYEFNYFYDSLGRLIEKKEEGKMEEVPSIQILLLRVFQSLL